MRASYAHHALARAIHGHPVDGFNFDQALAFRNSIRQRQNEFDNCLISAEPIYRMLCPQHVAELDHVAYWSVRERFIVHLREFFPGSDVRILVCFRRQDNFAKSYYQEKIKFGPYTKHLLDYIEIESQVFRCYQLLELFSSYFDHVDLLIYERLCREGLIKAFFSSLHIDVSDIIESEIDNVGLPFDFIEFKRIINLCELPRHQLQRINGAMTKLAPIWPVGETDPSYWANPDQQREFIQSSSEENERLRIKFAPHLEPPLFPEPTGRSCNAYEGITLENFARIAMLLRDSEAI